jgi:hypothetical protein
MNGILDNHTRGKVADFLTAKIAPGSKLSVVSAYFTIYAYEALANQLDSVDGFKFLFGEPRFISSLDPDKTDKKSFKIEDEGLELANRLQQKEVARRCAEWIRDKVEIRSVRQANLLHGKLYHIDDGRREHALLGSSNFTRRGLGLSATPNIELNLIVDGDRDRAELKEWFDQIWADEKLVGDVKDEVLRYLEQLYVSHSPEFIYFKTLFHVFGLADTEGQDLPEHVYAFPAKGTISVEQITAHTRTLNRSGVSTTFIDAGDNKAGSIVRTKVGEPPKGKSAYSMKINRNHNPNTQFATLAHELGHLCLGHQGVDRALGIPDRLGIDHAQREIEAESVSYLVCCRNGVENSSEAYLAGYVKQHTTIGQIDLYQVMRAAGGVEKMLGLNHHMKI